MIDDLMMVAVYLALSVLVGIVLGKFIKTGRGDE